MSTETTVHPWLPHLVTPLPGPKASQIIERDNKVLSPSYTRGYPFVMARGEGAVVEDVDGNRFLDFNAGIAVVASGHSHPRVVKAIQDQAARFLHMSGTDFYYENMVQLAEKLAALAPGDDRSAFTSEIPAQKRSRPQSNWLVITPDATNSSLFWAVSMAAPWVRFPLPASKVGQRKGFGPTLPVQHIPYAYCYRCAYGKHPDSCNVECVKVIEDQLFKTILPAEEVAAIVVEPIQGEGGYLVPPAKFHEECGV